MRKLIVGIFLVGIFWVFLSTTGVAQTITTSAISGSPFCNGDAVDIPFTITGTFNTGNDFIAELSDASGIFGSPTQIGQIIGSTVAGTISGTIPNLAGTGYRIRVVSTDPPVTGSDNGANLTIVVIQMTATKTSYNGEDLSCNGGSDGEINISASGGTGDYVYTLGGDATDTHTTSSSSHSFSGLAAGSYTIDVEDDATGCIAVQENITIIAPAALATSATTVDVLCFGDATGSVDLTVTGGTAAYTYLWSNAATTQDLTNIIAGTYSVTVTDANACTTVSADFTVNEPAAALATSATTVDVLCFGDATGSVDLTVTGGTAAYTYLWSNAATTQDLTNVIAGTYSVTVTDANACTTVSADFVVNEPAAALATSATTVDVLCFGDATGSVDLTVTGGTAAYTYLWSNAATTQDLTNVMAGTYSVTVTDANACTTVSADFVVNEPAAALATSATTVDVLCFGDATGSVDLTVTGGTAAYTYLWSNAATTQDLTNVMAGTYSVTVTDANACTTVSADFVVNEPAAALATSATTVDVLCFGDATGSVDLTVTGGTAAYTYLWSNAATTQDLTNVMAGTYSVTVTDANACTTVSADFTVNEPAAALATSATTVDVLCFGDATGSVDLTVTGGTAAYTYLWSNAATTQNLTNVMAGTYSVTVTDANACTTVSADFVVNEPAAALATSATTVDVLCFGDATGSVDLTVTGGTAAYTYLWSNAATTQDLTNVMAGTYSVTVTDANACTTVSADFTVNEPAAALATSATTVDVLCFGDATGSVDLTVTGGTAAYTYLWSNAATTQDLTNVMAGTYSVTVTDANACTTVSADFVVNEPAAALATSATTVDVLCFGDATGSVDLTVTGGTAAYTYLWSNAATTQDLTNVIAGTYSVTVTDANACTTVSADFVVNEPAAALATSATTVDVLCFGDATGSVDLTVTGGTAAYTYLWSNAATTQDLTNVIAGTYSVTVTDANACTTVSADFTVNEPAAALATSATTVDVLCFGDATGSVDLTVTGGTAAYTYLWSNAATTQDLTNVMAGTYSVTVTDANACTTVSADFVVNEPAAALATSATTVDVLCFGDATGSVDLTVTGGTAAYTYLWSNAATTQDLTNVIAGTYSVTVTDANACTTVSADFVVNEPAAALATSATTVDVLCFGDATGSVDLTVTGGTAAYTYLWSNAATTQDLTNVMAGTYSVTVTDANACTTVSADFVVNEPAAALSASTVAVKPLCFGGSDGAINVSASGGTPDYTFTLDGTTSVTQTSGDYSFIGLTAGNYTIDVKDANNCTVTQIDVTVTEPALLSATTSFVEPLCFAGNDGSITINATGGTTDYTFTLDGSSSVTQTSGAYSFTGLAAGDYTLDVSDANNCNISQVDITITQPAVLDGTTSFTEPSCKGGNDGTATIVAAGGTPPYTYSWDDPGNQLTSTATGLLAGNYIVTVTDANNCILVLPAVTITEPDLLIITETHNNIKCKNGTDGDIDITVTGGTSPYTYDWNNGATSQDISALSAGTYIIDVTDANNCTAQISIELTEPDILIAAFTQTNVSCNGLSDGSINVSVTGGTNPYSYSWDTGATTQDLSDLAAGTYILTITDANNCTDEVTVNITEPTELTLTYTQTNIDCNGGNNGVINITPNGGTPAYSFSWSSTDGSGFIIDSEDQSGLTAGTYTVIVTDINSCTVTSDIVITEPSALTISETHVNVSCKDGTDGSIDVTLAGGVPPYSYNWGASGTTEDLTNITAGAYNLMVTDANGCTIALPEVTITEPALLTITESHINVTCFDDNGTSDDASIDVTLSGGTGNYTYAWSTADGSGLVANAEDQAGLSAGSYDLLVTDENNCTASTTVIITKPDQLLLSAVKSDVTCFDDSGASNDGLIDLTVSGGSTFYSFAWSNGSTSEDLINLPAGDYTATVTDSEGCVSSLTITISQPDQLVISEAHTNVTCNDDSGSSADGSIDISIVGGTAPYSYLWSNGATTEDVSNLVAGSYSVDVNDANGCLSSATVIITEPTLLQISETHTNATCSESSNDGAIDITVTGGDGTYSYLWSNGETTEDITGLAAGDYSVTVTDATGCVSTLNITITKPGDLIITTNNLTEVTCNDDSGSSSDGAIEVSITGGTMPYSYLWSNGATTQNISGLIGGDYTLTITDANGCTANHMVTVFEPAVLAIAETHTDVLCFDGTTASDDGTIDITVTGGRSPYSYSWDNGASSEDLTGLAAGTYTITVTDINSCSSSIPITITKPTPIVITEVHTNVTCNDDSGTSDDGSLDISVSGGTAPYTYLWDHGATSEDLTSLAADTYNLTVTDANLCTNSISVVITQPDKMIITEVHTNVTCFDDSGTSDDGTITASVTGGTGAYSYLWDSGQTTSDINNLSAGSYTLTISDASGCSASLTVEITQPEQLLIAETFTHVTCYDDNGLSNDGSIDITTSGGSSPYTYTWTSTDGSGHSANDEDQTGLASGTYEVVVSDAAGCTSTSSITINQPQKLIITETHSQISCNGGNNGLIDITVTGGTSVYTFSWTNGATSEDISSLTAGSYTITVTDGNGCTAKATIVLTEPEILSISETHNDVTCFDDNGLSNDGTIQATVTGGTAPYSYLWNNGSSNASISSLVAGTYSLTVTDANSCSATLDVTIVEPELLTLTSTLSDVTCNDDNGSSDDGSIDITVTGGTTGYVYNWSTTDGSGLSGNDEDQTGLSAGNYTVLVTDINGCVTQQSFEIKIPQQLTLTENHSNVTCNDDNGTSEDGTIDLSVEGGTGAYTYLWSNNATTQDLSNLVAGTYTVDVSDASGCVASFTVSIDNPTALTMTVTNPPAVCQPETVDITNTFVSNFTGTVTYWTNAGLTNPVDDATAINTSGTYYINKISADGCATTRPVEVIIHPVPDLVAPTLDVLCNDQSVDLTMVYDDLNGTSGTVTYWLDAAATQPIPDPSDIRDSGTYYIKKVTAYGCTDIEPFDIAITLQPNLVITDPTPTCFPGTIDITGTYQDLNNTTGTITFWKNAGTTDPVADPTKIPESGIYYIQKTTTSGCSKTAEVNVVVNTLPRIVVSSPEIICEGEIVNLSTSYTLAEPLAGTMTYWLDANHTIANPNPQSVNTSGLYYYHFTSNEGCEDSEVLEVIVGQYPVLEVTDPEAVCEGEIVDIKPSVVDVAGIDGSFTYWKDASLTIPLTNGLASETGTYYVKKESIYNCASTTSVQVLVNKIPMLSITGVTEACSPATINLSKIITDINSTTGSISYWLDEALTTPVPNHTAISTSGDFYIKKTTIFGTCTDVVLAQIAIHQTPDAPIITMLEDTLFSNVSEGNQWFDDLGILPGATDQFYVPDNFGIYYVSQTLNNCESALSAGELYDPTGIYDEHNGIKFNVYPNPADNFITLVLEGFNGEATVTITDMKGVTIEQKTQMITSSNQTVTIDLSSRKNGPYIISIITGDKLFTQKLILR